MSRKSSSFGQLLRYFLAPERVGAPFVQNLRSAPADLSALVEEFQGNAQLLPRRKGGNVLFHEILSVSSRDADAATPAVLEALARQYLELRAP